VQGRLVIHSWAELSAHDTTVAAMAELITPSSSTMLPASTTGESCGRLPSRSSEPATSPKA
jgi:hypothetical protein